MTLHSVIIAVLLGLAVALTLVCAVGLAVMPQALQRLHFSAPVTSLGIFCVAVAVWVDDPEWQSRIKAALIAGILLFTNAILSHATGRAFFIRSRQPTEGPPRSSKPKKTAT